MTKNEEASPSPFPEWQNFGFAHSMFESPPSIARESGLERTKVRNQNSTHNHIIDLCVSKSSRPRCKLSAESVVGCVFTCPRAHTGSASHLHLYNILMRHAQLLAIVITVCANLMGVFVAHDGIAQTISVRGRNLCLTKHTFAPYSDMSRYMREYGHASSWKSRCWAPPAKQHTKNSCSGWSKRATRGHHSDYEDRSRQQEDNKPRTMRGSPRLWVRHRLRLSKTATRIMDVPPRTTPQAQRQRTLPGTLRRERLRRERSYEVEAGELHRLLNNRKCSLSATPQKER